MVSLIYQNTFHLTNSVELILNKVTTFECAAVISIIEAEFLAL